MVFGLVCFDFSRDPWFLVWFVLISQEIHGFLVWCCLVFGLICFGLLLSGIRPSVPRFGLWVAFCWV